MEKSQRPKCPGAFDAQTLAPGSLASGSWLRLREAMLIVYRSPVVTGEIKAGGPATMIL